MTMDNKLYVGNLPETATREDLVQLFGQHGTVRSVEIVTLAGTGPGRVAAHVHMDNDVVAQAAVAALNGSEYRGHQLAVHEAQPQVDRSTGPRPGGFGDRGGSGAGHFHRSRS